MPSEDRYVERDDPVGCADLVISGDSRLLSPYRRASPAQCLLQLRCRRAALERTPVQRHDRHHLPDRGRREHLVCSEQPLERVEPLLDDPSRATSQPEQGSAGLAGEDAGLE